MAETPLTDLDICNRALTLLAVEPIQGLGEVSDPADFCRQLYPGTRDALLQRHPWRFATKKSQLALDSQAPPIAEWGAAFQLPSDILGMPDAVRVDASDDYPITAWNIFGTRLYCDEDTVFVDHRWRAPEAQWTPLFAELVETALAAKLAEPITEDGAKARELHQRAFGTPGDDGQGGLYRAARVQEARQTPNKTLMQRGGPLVRARFGGGPRGYRRCRP